MARRLRITVDPEHCVGNGMCLVAAPRVFEHNADRQSTVMNPTGDPEDRILHAAANCPTNAIRVEDADTGEVLFP
jgi:ferredoxin